MFPHRIIVFIFLFVLSGCLGNVHQGVGSLPEWVESPPADNTTLYFGVGEGFSLIRAKEAALNDIAGKLGTDISSKISSDVRQYGDQVKSLAHQVITARIHKTKLIHPQIIKSAKYDGNFYVLLSVSRKNMAKDTGSRLKHIDQRLKQQWQSLDSLSRLQQFIRTQKLSTDIDGATALALTLQSLDHGFESDAYLARYNRYRKKSDGLLARTRFYIRPAKKLNTVVEHLLALLSRAEIQSSVSSIGRNTSSHDAFIEIKGEVKSDVAFSTTFARLTVLLEVKDGRGNIVASQKYKATGKSLNDAASAKRDAVEKLMKQWNARPVLTVIGLNL